MSPRDRHDRRRDIRRETALKPDLGLEVTDSTVSDINQTTVPGLEPPPNFYNVDRGTSTTSNGELTVPLRFPNREQMAVHMVPYNLVDTLEEYRSDGNKISGFFWTIIGSLLGIILSWIPDAFIKEIPSYVHYIRLTMVILLILFSIAVGLYWANISKRIKKTKSDLDNYQQ